MRAALETALANWRLGRLYIVFLPAFVLFGLGAATDIALPGVYMDAINPDYLVVWLLNPHPAQIVNTHVPGTVLFGWLPILGQIYHGALPYYVGLPFYALFGTGVVGIRLTNMAFGLLVLAAVGAFLWAFRVRVLICSLCLALLALDPGFLFSFRTQFYITLLPVAPLLASAALIEARAESSTRTVAIVSGLLCGIACYGYFIYGFLVPAIALFAVRRWGRLAGARDLLAAWVGGFVVGVLPYAVGFAGIAMATGGLHGVAAMLHSDMQPQGPPSIAPPVSALAFFIDLVRGTIIDVGPPAMMFQKSVPLSLPVLKMAVLLLVPAAAIATALARPARIRGLLVLAGMLLGFLVLVLTFGDRLWLHHAAFLLPVLYAALALALERFATLLAPRRRRSAGLVVAVLFAPFLIANASDRQAVFLQLEITRGVDLSSDGIDRYADDSLRTMPAAHRFFPDWGLLLPFVMLTRGSIPYSAGFTPAAARALLCAGQDVELSTLADRPAQRLRDWIQAVGWARYETARVLQADDRPLLAIVRWRAADRPPGACV